MRFRPDILSYLQELIFPEFCIGCNAVRGTADWSRNGAFLDGLRRWDSPHLCFECFQTMKEKQTVRTELELGLSRPTTIWAAQRTNPQLVALVSAWKYHGVRGLVWPLSQLFGEMPGNKKRSLGDVVWVPVPLHKRRHRERGFNQARMLAAQLAYRFGGVFMPDLIVRLRSTRQQARLSSPLERLVNVQNVFGWSKNRGIPDFPQSCRIMIVDDIVTSGATAGALGQFLASNGLNNQTIVCLGVAKPDIPAS